MVFFKVVFWLIELYSFLAKYIKYSLKFGADY